MRGSPWLRCCGLMIALLLMAMVVKKVTMPSAAARMQTTAAANLPATQQKLKIPFELVFSAPIQSGMLDSGVENIPLSAGTTATQTGSILLAENHSQISIKIVWRTPAAPDERRFAKLTLYPPNKNQIEKVFDARSDMDEFIELELGALQ